MPFLWWDQNFVEGIWWVESSQIALSPTLCLSGFGKHFGIVSSFATKSVMPIMMSSWANASALGMSVKRNFFVGIETTGSQWAKYQKKSEESVIRWKFAFDWSDTCNWKFIAAMFLNFGLAWSAWPNQEKLKILAAMNSQLRISLQSKEYFLQTQTLYLLRIFHFFWRNWRHVQIPSSVWKAEKKSSRVGIQLEKRR